MLSYISDDANEIQKIPVSVNRSGTSGSNPTPLAGRMAHAVDVICSDGVSRKVTLLCFLSDYMHVIRVDE